MSNQFSITYLSPATNAPTGGIKVFYKHAEMLTANGVNSYVFHPDNPSFICTWFAHNTQMRESGAFNGRHDFIVIPEMWAGYAGKMCLEINLKYAIYVQNGYLIRAGLGGISEAELQKIYERASLIAAISKDTMGIVSIAFPKVLESKIIRLLPSVSESFHSIKKKKMIAFMPRKLPEHAANLCFYLKPYLPSDWKLVPIEGRSEEEVVDMLSESSVFMSFSDQEGCPLPPLEAAFSGNLVVGYTGQGAKEYFHRPIFREVQNGDFMTFLMLMRQAIKDVEDGVLTSTEFARNLGELKGRYSGVRELTYLLNFSACAEKALLEQ